MKFFKYLLAVLLAVTFLVLSKEVYAQGQTINSPNSSTVCTQGQDCVISWYIYAGNDDIRIEYQISGSSSWTTIVDLTNVSQSGSYDWTIPSGLAAGSYRIRIGQSQSGGLYYAYWSESDYFQINEAPRLNISQPVAGNYTINTTVNVEIDSNVGGYTLELKNTATNQLTSLQLNGSGDWEIDPWQKEGQYTIVATEISGPLTDESGILTISQPADGVYSLNFVRTKTARAPATTESAFDNLTVTSGNATESVIYADGIGKPRQSISIESTVGGNHMVAPIIYDEIGVQTTSYQSYPTSSGETDFKVAAIEAQGNFYNNPSTGITANSHPYSVSVYEKSPLLTVIEQGAPGADWQPGSGHTIVTDTRLNEENELIHWEIFSDFDSDGLNDLGERSYYYGHPQGQGFYPEGEVVVTETTDEDGNLSQVYTDREGREVLKVGYQDGNTPVKTYYVYDTYGNLRFIIPPKAVEALENESNYETIMLDNSETIRTNWLTEMRYDEYGRVVEKKIPEAGWVYTVYDNLGRVALTQDGNMSANGRNDWFFTKYDIRGRAILTGLYSESDPGRVTRQEMQDHLLGESVYWENRSSANFTTQHGYTNDRVFPTGFDGVQVWSATWYDGYDFDYDGTPDEVFSGYPITITGDNLVPFEEDVYRTDGMVTGSKTLILQDRQLFVNDTGVYDADDVSEADEVYYIGSTSSNYSITLKPGFKTNPGQTVHIGSSDISVPTEIMDGEYLQGVTFYDKYGNSIYTKSTNHVGGTDESWTLYKFDGLVAETYTRHQSASETITVKNRFEYYNNGALSRQYHSINGSAETQTLGLSYNELGQVIVKNLHAGTNSAGYPNYAQSLDYTYHERGWLESVNNPDDLTEVSPQRYDDKFAYRLSYNNSANSGTNEALHNGTITNMEWRDTQGTHCYDYGYDGLSQLVQADYIEDCDAQSEDYSPTPNAYGTSYTYDVNGNIQTLERKSQGALIDNLDYDYDGIGNRITAIDDAVSGTDGFRDDYLSATTEYAYDENGNMTTDTNKGISFITYNEMNLPETITFNDGNKIVYLYDAAGTKLKQTTYPVGGGSGVTTDYSAGFVYENNSLAYFPFSEGTVRDLGGSFRYEYNLTDHLGNVRATFYTGQYTTPYELQFDHYYPFGLKMPGLSYLSSGTDENKFTYNGKELEDEFGLDWYHYGLRFYDPVVGRWWSVDPVDEAWSPYSYISNSPITYIDADGAFKEYPNSYKGELGPGDWLKSDRVNKTDRWHSANLYNLSQTFGYLEYTSIDQRAAFYGWFSDHSNMLGFETRWAGAASDVAFGVSMLDNNIVELFNATSPEAASFANIGNRMIFEDAFPKLRQLISGPILTGEAAYRWDAITLAQEQTLIQPLYLNTSAIGIISAGAKQKFFGSNFVGESLLGIPPFPENANIYDISSRWLYGMTNMGHNVVPNDMPNPGPNYSNGTMYRSIRRAGAGGEW